MDSRGNRQIHCRKTCTESDMENNVESRDWGKNQEYRYMHLERSLANVRGFDKWNSGMDRVPDNSHRLGHIIHSGKWLDFLCSLSHTDICRPLSESESHRHTSQTPSLPNHDMQYMWSRYHIVYNQKHRDCSCLSRSSGKNQDHRHRYLELIPAKKRWICRRNTA